MNRSQKIELFVTEIWSWFAKHKRTLPWRDLQIEDDTQRAYVVLVSEIMLQQTQVSRVEVIFKRFLRQFPTLTDLAHASNKDVIIAWQGMGYNSRALRLRDAAKTVLEDFNGVFPKEFNELRSIKGIGPYTAGAIRNFAFNIPTPCIDTNIRRIIHRVFVGPENSDGTWKVHDKKLLEIADEVLKVALRSNKSFGSAQDRLTNELTNKRTADWHAALMDFGSLVCRKSGVKVEICPLAKHNLYAGGPVLSAPKLAKKKTEPGRFVGSTFIPNRIFRGRVIEQLRLSSGGLTLEQLGERISVDWSASEHQDWLRGVLEKLKADALVCERRRKFALS